MADVITGSQLDPTQQQVVMQVAQRELAESVKLLPLVTDLSAMASPGVDTIKVPKLTSFTVINRAEGAAGDASALTATTTDLALDQNLYVSWIIDSYSKIQSNLSAQIEFARRGAAAHGRKIDQLLVAEALANSLTTSTAGAAITRDIILEMRETLLKNYANLSQMFLVINPTQESNLLKISEFSNHDVYGPSAQPIASGLVGSLYGVRVVVSTFLADTEYFMMDSEGLAIAFQQQPRMAQQPEIAYGTDAVRVAMDQILGVSVMQDVATPGISDLIIKDNNI